MTGMTLPETVKRGKLETLLDQLSGVGVHDIDDEISVLQARIDQLKRLRKLVEPKEEKAAGGSRRSKDEMKAVIDSIHECLRTNGPLKPGKLALKASETPMLIGRILKDSSRFQKLDDGTYKAI